MNIQNPHSPFGFNNFEPTMIVVHSMGEYIDTNDDDEDPHAVEFLEKMKLSAHALVAPDGTLFRCRDDKEGAYHAKGYNKVALGIEFLVPGSHTYGTFLEAIKSEYVTDLQYDVGLDVIRTWKQKFNIENENIVRHSDISPKRKFDPGDGFPWDELLANLS